jgi:hypothetical protein
MADQLAPADVRRRKSSVGAVELQGPGGVVRTVNLEDMSEADRALAAEFGYKPVRNILTSRGTPMCDDVLIWHHRSSSESLAISLPSHSQSVSVVCSQQLQRHSPTHCTRVAVLRLYGAGSYLELVACASR